MQTSTLKDFLLTFFAALEEKGIAYVVLRNVEEIYLSSGKDIDILVQKKDVPRVIEVAKEVCRKQNAFIVFRDSFLHWHHLHLFVRLSGRSGVMVLLDIKESVEYRSLQYLPVDLVLACRKKWEDIWCPCPTHEAICLFFHDILDKGIVCENYFQKIVLLRRENLRDFSIALRSILPDTEAQWLEECLDKGWFEEIIRGRKRVIALLKARSLKDRFFYMLWHIKYAMRQCRLGFSRRGSLVVVLGPDGVGKTTLIAALEKELEKLSLKPKQVYFGVRGALLPTKRIMRTLRQRKRKKREEHVLIGIQNDGRKWGYFLGSLHNLADQLLRYWVYVRPALARRRIVLTDRYFYDTITGPVPAKLYPMVKYLLKYFVPRPDLTIVLYDQPENIYARKQELSLQEIIRQQACYKDLASIVPNIVWIQVADTSKEIALRVLEKVMESIARRNAKQMI